MPVKEFQLNSGLSFKVYKRRSNRHIRISINPDNLVKVSIPIWAPYQSGYSFAQSKEDWIRSRLNPPIILKSGDQIGKSHYMEFRVSRRAKLSTQVKDNVVIIYQPKGVSSSSQAAQQAACRGADRALKKQAEQLLLPRLDRLAKDHGFHYSRVKFRALKSRWGSCDSQGRISLSIYLMKLPWPLIDYVLLHELNHLNHHNHSPEFWMTLDKLIDGAREYQKTLNSFQTSLSF